MEPGSETRESWLSIIMWLLTTGAQLFIPCLSIHIHFKHFVSFAYIIRAIDSSLVQLFNNQRTVAPHLNLKKVAELLAVTI